MSIKTFISKQMTRWLLLFAIHYLSSFILVGVNASMDVDIQRRALSDGGRDELDTSRAEFYSAVGPDGKEVILRKYLKDQAGISATQEPQAMLILLLRKDILYTI